MKKILYALTAIVLLTTACSAPKTEETQAGVYKMEKAITNDGTKDTVENSPNQVKIYTATHYVFAKLNGDSTVSFGVGSYKKEGNTITETNVYSGGGSDSAANFTLNLTKTETGYVQDIAALVMNGLTYKLNETYSKVAAGAASELDGLWKLSARMSIAGTDTTDVLAKYSSVQYKVFQDGHFIWVNRSATDSTKTAFQNSFGYGTFTFADGVSTEVPSTSSYASIVGMTIKVKITLTGKNEYTQEIVDEVAKTTSIEKYTRL
ncbi:MAG: hypothetical protein K9G06_00800 [Chitinophagaceae bacterium]|nr:hypothetical protein [Chitinophagaceae bacterium]